MPPCVWLERGRRYEAGGTLHWAGVLVRESHNPAAELVVKLLESVLLQSVTGASSVWINVTLFPGVIYSGEPGGLGETFEASCAATLVGCGRVRPPGKSTNRRAHVGQQSERNNAPAEN